MQDGTAVMLPGESAWCWRLRPSQLELERARARYWHAEQIDRHLRAAGAMLDHDPGDEDRS